MTKSERLSQPLDCNAIHQYFKKKLKINFTVDDISSKMNSLIQKNILSNKPTFRVDPFYFTENVDDIVEIAEDAEFVDEDFED